LLHLAHNDVKELLALLQTALELPVEQRERWLATLGPARSHLRPTVAALLEKEAKHETQEFLSALSEHTQGESREASKNSSPYPGAVVGPYRLIEPVGEGGMSSVWLAERDDATLKRRVALKLPHWWALSKLTERSAQERDILASLEHPNIARLYDAGTTPDGRPYLALEYIEGKPIDGYCKEHEMSLRERVEMLAQIARAVAYAHSRLIVHRDLKPSNIMIDASGQAHLLDFGIAKLIADGGIANQALTQMGTVLLTPAYASPEQILGMSVTTESDVYSLGLVAYEVLTGYRPYTFKSIATTGQEILAVEIHRPSDIAEREARALAGDLDTIILKTLKKDASERYGTAAAFADDLERWLRGDPVLAQPDSVGYRLRKFAGRHRLVVGAAAVVVLALATGLIVATWQLRVAQQERRHAEEVKEFVASIFRSADPYFTGNTKMSAIDLLTFAKDRIDREMASQPQNAAELLLIVGEAQSNLGEREAARATLEKALANAANTLPADSLEVAAGYVQLAGIDAQESNYDRAEQNIARALPVLRKHATEREGAKALSTALLWRGYIAGDRREKDQALANMAESYAILRAALGDDDSETILSQRQLAQEYLLFGDVEQGLANARAAYDNAIRHFGTGGRDYLLVETEDMYGRALVDSGELEKGIEHLRKVIAATERMLGGESSSTVAKLTWLARAQLKLGDVKGAVATLEQSEQTSKNDPLDQARIRTSLGAAYTAARRNEDAARVLEPALKTLRELDTTGATWIGNCLSSYGSALAFLGRNEDAERILKEATGGASVGPALADAWNAHGFVALNRKDFESARTYFAKARDLSSAGPPSRVVVAAFYGLGLTDLATNQLDAAAENLSKAEATQRATIRQPAPMLIDILSAHGQVALAQGKREDAAQLFATVNEFWRQFAPESSYAREASAWRERVQR
jgi:hypothetical protein